MVVFVIDVSMVVGMCRLYVFFFQAEDGIRDAQESRGLGDVYKRQQEGRQEEGASRHLPVSIFLFFIFIFTIFSYSLLTEASPLSVSPEILSMV